MRKGRMPAMAALLRQQLAGNGAQLQRLDRIEELQAKWRGFADSRIAASARTRPDRWKPRPAAS